MKGIYKFTNKINGKIYIGQSLDLRRRYISHKNNYKNPNSQAYKNAFYAALRKYGFENFDYEIITQSENFDKDQLNELEKYYIDKYKSYENGYNMNPGGNNTGGNYKISSDIILAIKEDLKNNLSLSLSDIQHKYNISTNSIISNINSGNSYNEIGQYNYPIRTKDQMIITQQGENNSKAIFSNQEVLMIRKDFQNCTLSELFEKYKDKISFSGLKKIVYGIHYTHLPIYKKKEKRWYLNGTCIDYPREEEQGNQ